MFVIKRTYFLFSELDKVSQNSTLLRKYISDSPGTRVVPSIFKGTVTESELLEKARRFLEGRTRRLPCHCSGESLVGFVL